MLYFEIISVSLIFLLYGNCESLKLVPKNQQNATLQVRILEGVIQGQLKHTISQKLQYFSFEGIPYALPPIGDLRFRSPVPAQNWTGVLNTSTSDIYSCIQVIPAALNELMESEDCLYINVFTPVKDLKNAPDSLLLPVMVWIYGGAFLLGAANSNYFGPDNLLEENVIVVHFGYRLASFGFLSTGDLESPGNYGLKDQHLALKWVKKNIEYFGGDPNRITIFGESAGSASVQYQLMYQENEGLFQGAISESGSILCVWANQRRPRKIAFDLGVAAGKTTNSTKELVQYLRSLSTEALKSATIKASLKNTLGIISGIPFAPTVEPEHPEAFITGKAHQMLQEGNFIKVPYIIGFNSAETYLAKSAIALASPLLLIYDIDPGILVPSGMNAEEYTNKVGELIKEFYLKDRWKPESYLEYINDGYFYRPIIESARLFAGLTPTFLYCFSYEGILGRMTLGYTKVDQYKGVVHTEEMAYIWSRHYLPEPNCTDKTVTARMVRMWANFAKTGSPTPQEDILLENVLWPPLSMNMEYLEINSKMSIKHQYRNKSMTFWKEIYAKYGRPPFDTY